MKKKILKLFLVANIAFFQAIKADTETENVSFDPNSMSLEQIEMQREALQQLLLDVRNQTDLIGSSIQTIIQKIQYGAVSSSSSQKENALAELKEFLYINQLLRKNLTQINPTAIQEAVVYNSAIVECLLKVIQSNILEISVTRLSNIIEMICQKFNPEEIPVILTTTNIKVEKLLYLSDSLGLSWYNKTYRYFKNIGAGTAIKNLTYAGVGIFSAYILYKMINPSEQKAKPFEKIFPDAHNLITDFVKQNNDPQNLTAESLKEKITTILSDVKEAKTIQDLKEALTIHFEPNQVEQITKELTKTIPAPELSWYESAINNLIGEPGKVVVDAHGNMIPDPNDPSKNLITAPTGLHKLGFLSGVATSYLFSKIIDDVKPYEKIKSIYAPWFHNVQYNTHKALTRLDEFLEGSSQKQLFLDEYENVRFDDMTGAKHLEEEAKIIAKYMKNPDRYQSAQIEIHRGILLYGPPQTGKTLFAKALRTLVQEIFGDDQKMHFLDVNAMMDINGWTVEYCFWYARQNAPCILFFDEIDLTGGHREKSPISTKQLLEGMQGIYNNKKLIVIGATNKPEQLDSALLKAGRFGKRIYVDYPTYPYRNQFLTKQIEKRGLNIDPEYIDHIAQETDGCSYNDLKSIIDNAMINSDIELQPVTEKHFEKALDTEIRKIQPTNNMSPAEKEIVATYQAGKALTRHLLQTTNQVVKVTINNVNKNIKVQDMIAIKTDKDTDNDKIAQHEKDPEFKYGEVFTKALSDNSNLLNDERYEHECLALLAGGVALNIMFHKTFSKCNPQDRAEAMKIIKELLSKGEKANEKIIEQAIAIKNSYEEKLTTLLTEHKELLEKIIQKLIDQNTIDRYEWIELVN